ncbi:BZIP transcription factor [Colletotrichum higginsianum IMI 349063]|uniref:BZIP transcription factor n=2 Tax=Colletotrichum higginsianum TaxID=80884 RepID=A0A1B7XTX1_COLHI|nr:BZIP transcription factor [Colletotrichum higginsianum IMI 349063]OBR03212.1 BZIP transcription factor [Colletotrichum higginsianum IMI 349063]TIC89881.1 Transcription factor atf1 [Colletotrichum higginsianum]
MMDSSAGGLHVVRQSEFPNRTAFFEPIPSSAANSTDDGILRQLRREQLQHQQQNQRTHFLFQQQQQRLQQPAEYGTTTTPSQSAYVDPSTLNSVSEAAPSASAVGRQSSTPTQSSSGWQDSPMSNAAADSLSSPASSVISPHSTSFVVQPTPPIDPRVLGGLPKETIVVQPKELTAVAEEEAPKRRRGRPRLSEAVTAQTTRAASPKTKATATTTTTATTMTTTTTTAKTNMAKSRKNNAPRRTSTASAASGTAGETADERPGAGAGANDKKNRIRARNREAAYKCRKKKQKGIAELQTQEAMIENVNRTLNSEAAMLRSEILMLKNMVLQHGGCGCSFIEEYISGAAQNLVQSSMAAAASGGGGHSNSGNGGGMQQIHDQNCTNRGDDGEGYNVDWKGFDIDSKAGIRSLGSESGFSGFDDAASHSARAQSQGAPM